MNYNSDLREILEVNNAGVVFTYKGRRYKIINGMIIMDMTTGEFLMLRFDF